MISCTGKVTQRLKCLLMMRVNLSACIFKIPYLMEKKRSRNKCRIKKQSKEDKNVLINSAVVHDKPKRIDNWIKNNFYKEVIDLGQLRIMAR